MLYQTVIKTHKQTDHTMDYYKQYSYDVPCYVFGSSLEMHDYTISKGKEGRRYELKHGEQSLGKDKDYFVVYVPSDMYSQEVDKVLDFIVDEHFNRGE